MPFRLAAITALALSAAVLLIAACGDDDGPGGSPTETISGSRSATASATDSPGPTDDGSDNKTPPPSDLTETPTAAATAPGEIPTPPPTASQGTPAIRPTNEAEFLAQFAGADITFVQCSYDQSAALANCGDSGLYAPDPPIVGQDVSCDLWVIDSAPRAMQCRSVEPNQTVNYEVG